jgi:hypothetical protein
MQNSNLVPFDVYWPCLPDGNGEITPPRFIATVQIPVIGEGEYAFLTEEAHRIIDTTKFTFIFKEIFNDDTFFEEWWKTLNPTLDGSSPQQCIEHPKTQRLLADLATDMLKAHRKGTSI